MPQNQVMVEIKHTDDFPMNALAGPSAEGDARSALAREANDTNQDKAITDRFLSPADQDKYGLSVRINGGKVEAYFRAGGQDNVVASSDVNAPDLGRNLRLDANLKSQMDYLTREYKVTFGKAKEPVAIQQYLDDKCKVAIGDLVSAVQPRFSDLYAAREALAHSAPSHLSADGRSGIKMYFLDKNIYPKPVYGEKFALGVYEDADKDKKIALYITPEGRRLPATAKDTMEQGRNLALVMEHEMTHNSEHNNWKDYPFLPEGLPQQFGWSAFNRIEKNNKVIFEAYGLKGKNGEQYFNYAPKCGAPTAWVARKDEHMLDEAGKPVSEDKAAHFTNEQVQASAEIRPLTYYFPKPIEMFSEGLTTFRTSKSERARELRESPQFYEVVKEYDNKEIARFYGVDRSGKPNLVRTPEGTLAPNTAYTAAEIAAFEKSVKEGR